MNNWTIVFLIIGVVVILGVISGFVLTNKALNIGGKIVEPQLDPFGNPIGTEYEPV